MSTKLIALSLALIIGSAANASSINITDGDSFLVNFNGVVEGTVEPGLTATANFSVTDVDYNSGIDTTAWNFTISLSNTSGGTIDASRVSILGFDTNPDVILSQSSVTGGSFDTVTTGNMPQLGTLEVCLTDVNCAGGGGGGVDLGSVATLMATLTFAGEVDSLMMDNFGVRYQSIVGSQYGTSGTGFGTVVPIPAALWLFLSALMGLFAARRLRSPGKDNATNAINPALQPA